MSSTAGSASSSSLDAEFAGREFSWGDERHRRLRCRGRSSPAVRGYGAEPARHTTSVRSASSLRRSRNREAAGRDPRLGRVTVQESAPDRRA